MKNDFVLQHLWVSISVRALFGLRQLVSKDAVVPVLVLLLSSIVGVVSRVVDWRSPFCLSCGKKGFVFIVVIVFRECDMEFNLVSTWE